MICLTETSLIASAVRAGLPLTQIRERYEPNQIARELIDLCERVGAPLAENLDRLARVEQERERALADLRVSASGPRASAKLVTILPLVVLCGAQLIGLRVFNQPPPLTWWSIGLGVALLLAGRAWSAKVVRRAEPSSADPGQAFDHFACCLSAGLTPAGAAEVIGGGSEFEPLISEAESSGLAIASLAQAAADNLRLRWKVASDEAIRRAAVQLLWPLGLAVLPAFVLMAVVPIGIALLKN